MTVAVGLVSVVGAEHTDTVRITLGDVGWQAHPEVWLLIAGVAAIGVFMHRVLEPKAVAAGYPAMTWGQNAWFGLAAASMWLVSDWPVHDVAENHLYSVHMFQHLFISMLVPAMFLLALPAWLFELLWPPGSRGHRFWARASRPLVAGLIFNALTALLHWSWIVAAADRFGPLHFSLHLLIFSSGLLMWMPVIGPVREWRLAPMGQCIYLFMMSIMPTVPGGWLVFAHDVVYRNYDVPERLWGIEALTDQQAAGVVMKLMGGFVLWAVILVIFARWATDEMRQDEEARRARHREAREAGAARAARAARVAGRADDVGPVAEPGLTFEQVAEQFARTPAPSDPQP